ncbi:hypothetical protein BAAM1489_05165 [Bifidobacterium animalis subsp. animalis MCC 1489]|nr:type II toxin-antitoxin system YoeB family toxin [Bifidobacterium animalis]AFI62370.1 hypothetical protein BANAN_00715 [Bifidobacterium animalis subsp. animalis ATCC 25527]AGW84367.1 hypothetical protein BLAC_00705 [Bifidobacterium animalis subsp. lactis ATCC 27673]KFI41934.1 Toxin yoeB [Bifidobacterium animalis subsp. animalis]KOA48157.1 hypothetical protein BAAA27673_01010 [Bifidobacterium animalis subsp. lactis ATCC 27673]KOA63385.1 hypothetical protein BAAM1489_05165 [Bifidobacterium an
MLKIWTDEAWGDYLHWRQTDKRALRKINALIYQCFERFSAFVRA